jgi:hypothetical protein
MIIPQSRSELFENSMLWQSNVYSAMDRGWLADNATYSMLDGKLFENRLLRST